MHSFRFEPVELPPEAEAFRFEVRDFIAENVGPGKPHQRALTWGGFDPGFSKKMGDAGYLGMTFAKEYGGHGRSAFERYVMLEEMLAAGAPVSAHWTGDRQSGPSILKFGTEDMKREIIPKIVAGDCFFCIGMSEPDSGSDLASIRTRATKTDGGWLINGTKVWTSGAHEVDFMIALVRTDPEAEKKHDGMSQIVVDLGNTDGITISPIKNLVGEEHFNQVIFEDAFIPDARVLGQVGEGWKQVISELGFERSGPERYMSSYQLIRELLREVSQDPTPAAAAAVGRLVAHMATLRSMSASVSAKLQAGEDPALDGSVVKDLGTVFEQSVPLIAHQVTEREPSPNASDEFERTLAYITQVSPSFSIRGGTREVLRGIIARGLGLR
jgi:alkylation response protein AidB-like acyl-CoA dehydrogenase